VPFLPRSFLPEFNEGNIYVTLLLDPGTSLAESFRIGHMGDQILAQVPEVVRMSRRSGRYDGDSDIDPVNDNEWPLKIKLDKGRRLHEVMDDIRNRMAIFSGDLNVTQFLIERMQSEDQGVRGDVILKIFGPDLPTLRTLAMGLRDAFAHVPGLTDVLVEQQTYSPQARIAVDYGRAKLFGITPAQITEVLQSFSNGRTVSQVIEAGRRFDVVMRLNDADRTPEALKRLRIEKSLLHRVRSARGREAFDGRDRVAVGAEGGDQAGMHGLAVDQDGTGAAVAGVASLLDAEMAEVAKKGSQALPGARGLRKILAVDLNGHGYTRACSSARISSARRSVMCLRQAGLPCTSS